MHIITLATRVTYLSPWVVSKSLFSHSFLWLSSLLRFENVENFRSMNFMSISWTCCHKRDQRKKISLWVVKSIVMWSPWMAMNAKILKKLLCEVMSRELTSAYYWITFFYHKFNLLLDFNLIWFDFHQGVETKFFKNNLIN